MHLHGWTVCFFVIATPRRIIDHLTLPREPTLVPSHARRLILNPQSRSSIFFLVSAVIGQTEDRIENKDPHKDLGSKSLYGYELDCRKSKDKEFIDCDSNEIEERSTRETRDKDEDTRDAREAEPAASNSNSSSRSLSIETTRNLRNPSLLLCFCTVKGFVPSYHYRDTVSRARLCHAMCRPLATDSSLLRERATLARPVNSPRVSYTLPLRYVWSYECNIRTHRRKHFSFWLTPLGVVCIRSCKELYVIRR